MIAKCLRPPHRQLCRTIAAVFVSLLASATAVSAQNTFPSAGNVGIGTSSPNMNLHVYGASPYVKVESSNNQGAGFFFRNTSQQWYSGLLDLPTSSRWTLYDVSLGKEMVSVQAKTGNVGIGTINPTSIVHAYGSAPMFTLEASDNQGAGYIMKNTVQQWYFGLLNNVGVRRFSIYDGTSGQEPLSVQAPSGNVGIGTTNPTAKLHVAGSVQVDGNIAAKYQDVAEWVRSSSSFPPGTVVAIDVQDSDRVVATNKPYDTRVAGVVSLQPGVVLGEPGQDKVIVAHSGRVRVKVDAGYGPVSRGDLLVASPTVGYAMRSEPVSIGGITVHQPGTLIGKALEPLDEGKGEILVLLTLQ